MHQLVCNGIFETVAIRKAGFSLRMDFDRFIDKFWILMTTRDYERSDIETLLQKTMPDANEWCMGLTKVFLKDSAVDKLSNELSRIWKVKATPIQAHIRRYNEQLAYQTVRAIRITQCYIRRHQATVKLHKLREFFFGNRLPRKIYSEIKRFRRIFRTQTCLRSPCA